MRCCVYIQDVRAVHPASIPCRIAKCSNGWHGVHDVYEGRLHSRLTRPCHSLRIAYKAHSYVILQMILPELAASFCPMSTGNKEVVPSRHTPEVISQKIKDFFRYYAINRHKATTITPAYHAESYSPDDNRFDHRPFLYHILWSWQFNAMDKIVARLKPR